MTTAKRHRHRDKASLFVEIDADLLRRVNAEAVDRGVNKWEVVQEALLKGLPLLSDSPTPVFEGLDRIA